MSAGEDDVWRCPWCQREPIDCQDPCPRRSLQMVQAMVDQHIGPDGPRIDAVLCGELLGDVKRMIRTQVDILNAATRAKTSLEQIRDARRPRARVRPASAPPRTSAPAASGSSDTV